MRCFFCQYKTEPSFKDTDNLDKFLSARKKIIGRERSGLCAKHQRSFTKEIKYARYLGLIAYVSYQGLR
ncbi:30S ribosomal protein S18 [Candidatus Roizmanbacteria bacterium CG_4_10_14_0_2_um_filter_36_35]|uniref:30S ribosomal protein S18 n=4 Tax=Candidatus Roizmaniibacteriota TaxID=1752723 RepID=A0A2M7BW17_9BACT|nr:MAG: 30S ribosomal protein S18 [Candidatus Roizmanbacteria bacterium CG11_big_fil_rev_8_21_14_0_20_35_14]PIV10772.1 MAG: 30S ribosomal protein S18 [Candidatus Roizmanbacteria bacterium CG03_land_8_20_14_0_80_35_26]PIZ67601.1 MAG: 30S ribosomal protein S18 [Candidatus Roizmanbacteria bacterium CG_4_10_14_0_2_um_filter_36_35]PJC31570.1 MAG: 30S ribosomal protein S18 [Candidatus Roizmanbacteria bacterium CG_4_9_14_0_2_um_filter_36_12]PJC80253.1 MAG: 30S ribosomal protein S18 [Candidatus Roizman